MATTDFDRLNRQYIFPVQFLLGVFGNSLNLIVLNAGKQMRTKTNAFLTALCVADLLFFSVQMPFQLQEYNILKDSVAYELFFYYGHIPKLMMANWFSAASIWLTVGVTVERVLAIKFPLRVKHGMSRRQIALTVLLIYFVSFLLAIYNLVERKVTATRQCTPIGEHLCVTEYTWTFVRKDVAPWLYYYVQVSQLLFGIFVVFLPIVLLTGLNIVLIRKLLANRRATRNMRRNSSTGVKHSELKATFLVCVIIIAFIALNLPSGVFLVVHNLLKVLHGDRSQYPTWYHHFHTISNSCVCWCKAVNFILYCLASSRFRHRLKELIQRCVHSKPPFRRRMQTTITNDGTTATVDVAARRWHRRSGDVTGQMLATTGTATYRSRSFVRRRLLTAGSVDSPRAASVALLQRQPNCNAVVYGTVDPGSRVDDTTTNEFYCELLEQSRAGQRRRRLSSYWL